MIKGLPTEVLLLVFVWLEPADLCAVACTCRHWRNATTRDGALWFAAMRRASRLDVDELRRLSVTPANASMALYHKLITFLSQLDRNWKSGQWRKRSELRGHTDLVLGLHLDRTANLLASASFDTTIKLWDLDTMECVRTMYGHGDGVLCVQLFGRLVLSGSYDMTIILWDRDTGAPIATLADHTGWVVCIQYDGKRLLSGSWDTTIRLWNVEPNGQHSPCQHVFWGHSEAVTTLQFKDNYLVSGSGDKTIRVWDIESRACLMVLQGHQDLVRSVRFNDEFIFSASFDHNVRVWDRACGDSVKTLCAHRRGIWSLSLRDNTLLSGSRDGTVAIWILRDRASNDWVLAGHLSSQDDEHDLNAAVPPIQFPEASASARPRTRGGAGWSATPLAAVLRDADEEEGGEGPARNAPIARLARPTSEHIPPVLMDDIYAVQQNHRFVFAGSRKCTIRVWDFSPPLFQ